MDFFGFLPRNCSISLDSRWTPVKLVGFLWILVRTTTISLDLFSDFCCDSFGFSEGGQFGFCGWKILPWNDNHEFVFSESPMWIYPWFQTAHFNFTDGSRQPISNLLTHEASIKKKLVAFKIAQNWTLAKIFAVSFFLTQNAASSIWKSNFWFQKKTSLIFFSPPINEEVGLLPFRRVNSFPLSKNAFPRIILMKHQQWHKRSFSLETRKTKPLAGSINGFAIVFKKNSTCSNFRASKRVFCGGSTGEIIVQQKWELTFLLGITFLFSLSRVALDVLERQESQDTWTVVEYKTTAGKFFLRWLGKRLRPAFFFFFNLHLFFSRGWSKKISRVFFCFNAWSPHFNFAHGSRHFLRHNKNEVVLKKQYTIWNEHTPYKKIWWVVSFWLSFQNDFFGFSTICLDFQSSFF